MPIAWHTVAQAQATTKSVSTSLSKCWLPKSRSSPLRATSRSLAILFCNYAVYATRGLLTELQPARDNVFFYTLGRTDEDAQIPIDYSDGGAG